MPKGAVLREANGREDGTTEFIFEAPVDPNDDRLEHWEQEVVGKRHLHEWRAELVWSSMRSMMVRLCRRSPAVVPPLCRRSAAVLPPLYLPPLPQFPLPFAAALSATLAPLYHSPHY